jgi:hypothetical protein
LHIQKLSVLVALLTVMSMAAPGCGGDSSSDDFSPTSPSPNPPPSGGSVPNVLVRCPEFGESSRCTAFAAFDNASGQEVTGLATWSTGDSSIATVTSGGLVTAQRMGEVSIRASYLGGSGFAVVWAVPGDGLHGTSRTLQGTILGLAGPLSDVVMEILNGPNAGRRTTTFPNGVFLMDGLRDGQFTIRLSKPGYITAEYVWRIPGGRDRIATLTAR